MNTKFDPEAALFAFRASAVIVAAAIVSTVLLPLLSAGAHVVA